MVKTERIFKVHSGIRKRHTKDKRRGATGRQAFVQRLAGGVIVVRRARTATITESKLMKHIDEFKRAFAEGKVEVRTITGLLVDLDTLNVVEAPPVTPPQPDFPLDSAANDTKNVGEKLPPFLGGKAPDEVVEPPAPVELPGSDPEEPIEAGVDPVEARKRARKRRGE